MVGKGEEGRAQEEGKALMTLGTDLGQKTGGKLGGGRQDKILKGKYNRIMLRDRGQGGTGKFVAMSMRKLRMLFIDCLEKAGWPMIG